jgi:hypothetical protein
MRHKVRSANVLVPDRIPRQVRRLAATYRVSVTSLAVYGLQFFPRRHQPAARQTANSPCNPVNPPQPQQSNTLPVTTPTPVTVPVNL